MASQSYSVNLNINANASSAKAQLQDLQRQLQQISNMKVNIGAGNLTADIEKASQAAMKLSAHLATATNPQTGNLDFTKFYSSIKQSGATLEQYGEALQKMGPAGQKAFIGLADSISRSEIPLMRTNKLVDGMWNNLKKTVGWQISSSMIHGFIGGVQQAVGYAKDLNKSLTDIRIVTGQSSEQMATFAKEANKMAKVLNTTTTDYTKASLIYYQQGLSDAEVKERTETTIKMANVTGQSAQKVSDQMTAIWNNYDNGTKSLTHYADVMTALGASTASSTDEIAEGLQKFASISNTVGLSYEYAASALATITATSRESADVVGNSLKTLFSRIQGLQLGETLDDGTTLNKYSTALAKVGISIKDSSGEMKDMDNILDEMGTKWQTLASDEKMALAQTVAGVRQYTQLMTLMENWDQFKQNLNIANTSQGTVDAQAAIYAESWQAASNKVRASWEGLWDSLINSEGFIGALNGLSTFISGFETLIDGMGGAKGALNMFSAAMLKIFNPKLSSIVNDVGYGIGMLMGGEKQMIKTRDGIIGRAANILTKDDSFLYGEKEAQVRKDILKDQLGTSMEYAKRKDSMTPFQHLMEQQWKGKIDAQNEQQIKYAKEYDESKSRAYEAQLGMMSYDKKTKTLTNPFKNKIREEEDAKKAEEAEEAAKQRYNQLQEQEPKNKKGRKALEQAKLNYEAAQAKTAQYKNQAGNTYDEQITKDLSGLVQLKGAIAELGGKDSDQASANLGKVNEQFEILEKATGIKGLDEQKATIQQAIQDGQLDTASAAMNKYIESFISSYSESLTDQGLKVNREELTNYLKEKLGVIESGNKILTPEERKKQQQERIQNMKEEAGKNWGKALISAGQGANAALSFEAAFTNMIDSIKSGTMGLGDSISALSSMTMSAGMAINGFSNTISSLGIASGKSANLIGLAISAALVVAKMAADAIDDYNNRYKIAAEESAQNAKKLESVHSEAEQEHESLINQIDAYKEAEKELRGMTYGSSERVAATKELNEQAMSLINTYNLKEGQYSWAGDQIKIKDDVLNNLKEQTSQKVLDTDSAMQQGQLEQKQAYWEAQRFELGESMRGDFAKHGINPYLSVALNKLWDSAGEPTELLSTTYNEQISKGLEYLTNNGVSILNEEISKIAETIGITTEAADVLKTNKNQIDNTFKTYDQINDSLKLVNDGIGKNIIAQNAAAQSSQHTIALSEASGRVYEKAYKNFKETVHAVNAEEKAIEYAQILGYNSFDVNTITDKGITYSYIGANNEAITGEMSFDQISSGLAAAQANNYLDTTWINETIKSLDALSNKTGGKGLGALLTAQDFDSSTIGEIQAYQEAISGLFKTADQGVQDLDTFIQKMFGTGQTAESVAKQFGLTTDELSSLILQGKYFDTTAFDNILNDNGFNESDFGGKQSWMTIDNLQNLATQMGGLGTEAGTEFANGLYNMLQDSGIKPSEWSNALNMLLTNVDWSSWDALSQANSVITSLGGSLDIGTDAWYRFAQAMREATGAIPDFGSLIDSLSALIALLNSLKAGDTIGEDQYNALMEKFGKDSKYADMFKVNAAGEREFIGNEQDAEDIRKAFIEESEASLKEAQQRADDVNAARKNIQESAKNGNKAAQDISDKDVTWDDVMNSINPNSGISDQINAIVGDADISGISNKYEAAKIDFEETSEKLVEAEGKLADAEKERENAETDAEKAAADAKILDAQKAVEEAQAAKDAAQAEMDNYNKQKEDIQNQINDAVQNGAKGITDEQKEQLASAKYDTYAHFEEGKQAEDSLIIDEEGNLTSVGEKQLRSLAQLYPEVSAEAERYKQILEDTNATEQEREDAQQLLEERLAAAEAAKQMGLEYNEVVEKMEELKEINKDNESFKKINNSGLAELASEALKVDKAMVKLHKEYSSIMKEINNPATKTSGLEKLGKILKDIAQLSDRATVSTKDLTDAYQRFIKKHPDGLSKIMKGDTKAMADYAEEVLKNDLQKLFKGMDWDKEIAPMMEGAQNAVSGLTEGMTYELADLPSEVQQVLAHAAATVKADGGGLVEQIEAMSTAAEGLGLEPQVSYVDVEPTTMSSKMFTDVKCTINGHNETHTLTAKGPAESKEQGGKIPYITFTKKSGGKGPGGGGGGGGGGKEPKKVANQRKSQTVKRYKENNYHRDNAERSAKLEENKKEYLYGETKIEQLEKINKLAEKEAKITADRISESRKYLVEDRQNLIKYMQKYGFEAEFDSDGFLASYEEAWTKVYEEIAALYEDNLLTEEESKIEEELKVKLEELEGALEDYENSLKELAEDIEKYEESLYDMYDSKLEQLEHRLEFRLELNEDDMSYIDFLIEALGENASKAVDRISLITQKSTALFDNIVRVKENIQAIYDLSDDPFQMWATGGLDIDGLLTEAQVEQLREHRDQLMDYMKELLEMRETIQEEVLNVFDAWTEKIDHNISAIDHYTSVLEYFKNVIDITGKDVFGMSDSFVRSIESAAIDQSMDSIEANKAYYENLVQANAEAEQALQEARARGDTESEEHWEEVVRSTSESMQSAQDALLSALENTLTMISDQFTAAMEDAVEQFNESIYASGGLEGLSNDYSLLREQADLMAEDYDKIYNLTKLTRNINKTLDDTNIIAGKQRLTKLLQEVNDLQKSGVELSKYDLEYLEAKYNLYLAQIELENAQGNKDTVQLSRDSEGNWSYVYTTNEEKVNEAQQKYEDALYEMQNMNHEYMEEMSSSMIDTAAQMSEEIANLQISDFANLEEYNNKVQEIREKYEQSLNLQNEELNKVIDNNESLYETDWQNYSKYTGYKISADKDWIDSFRETTLGHLMGSESVQSDFNQTIIGLTDTLAQGLSDAAVQYFTQMNTALQAYGSSIDGFSGHIVSMTNTVKEQSDEAAKATESMGKRMEDAFSDVVTAVKEWQEIEAPKIEEELEAIKTLIEEINESIRTSAELTTDKDTSIIGSSKAIELINDSGLFGSWKINDRGDINVSDGTGTETTNFVDYNAKLLEELDDAIELHANGRISDDALAEMFKRYWVYKDIVNRIYDTTNIDAEKELEEKERELEKKLSSSIKFDTGGYTGEWGNEGKIAMLHEKELVLNANDTSNFLEALNISRQLIEMIEMNARASSLGLGEMVASTIKDTSQTIEQQVNITAEFPNATDHSEIEEAFDNLINIASQYAYRNE